MCYGISLFGEAVSCLVFESYGAQAVSDMIVDQEGKDI